MGKHDVIDIIRSCADQLRQRGVTALYLFGSVAQDTATEQSDIDLFIDYDQKQKISLFGLVAVKQFLEERLQSKVDVTTRDSLHPELRADIEKMAVQII